MKKHGYLWRPGDGVRAYYRAQREWSRRRGRVDRWVVGGLVVIYVVVTGLLGAPRHFVWWLPLLVAVPTAVFAVVRVMIEPATAGSRYQPELEAGLARTRATVWDSGGEPPILPEPTPEDPSIEDIVDRFPGLGGQNQEAEGQEQDSGH